MKKRKKICFCFCLLICLNIGCGRMIEKEKKVRDLDYTVVAQEEIPKELQSKIEEKKQEPFNLTMQTDDGMYLVRGYGKQSGGNYSIQVQECYLTNQAVYVKTELNWEQTQTNDEKKENFPYIVIKTQRQTGIVIFK